MIFLEMEFGHLAVLRLCHELPEHTLYGGGAYDKSPLSPTGFRVPLRQPKTGAAAPAAATTAVRASFEGEEM
jgi:hypothetical protein